MCFKICRWRVGSSVTAPRPVSVTLAALGGSAAETPAHPSAQRNPSPLPNSWEVLISVSSVPSWGHAGRGRQRAPAQRRPDAARAGGRAAWGAPVPRVRATDGLLWQGPASEKKKNNPNVCCHSPGQSDKALKNSKATEIEDLIKQAVGETRGVLFGFWLCFFTKIKKKIPK